MMTTVTIALLLVSAATAAAQESDGDKPKAGDDVQHTMSITVSPVHLFLPMVELMVEHRVADKIGLAGIVGVGSVTVEVQGERTNSGGVPIEETNFMVFEGGAQGRYYVIGNFIHGMEVGAEIMYAHVSTDDDIDNVSGVGQGLAVGPFVGYKIATNSGFTFDGQLGAQFMMINAAAEDKTTGESESDSDSDVIPLLNLNIGWSF